MTHSKRGNFPTSSTQEQTDNLVNSNTAGTIPLFLSTGLLKLLKWPTGKLILKLTLQQHQGNKNKAGMLANMHKGI